MLVLGRYIIEKFEIKYNLMAIIIICLLTFLFNLIKSVSTGFGSNFILITDISSLKPFLKRGTPSSP